MKCEVPSVEGGVESELSSARCECVYTIITHNTIERFSPANSRCELRPFEVCVCPFHLSALKSLHYHLSDAQAETKAVAGCP